MFKRVFSSTEWLDSRLPREFTMPLVTALKAFHHDFSPLPQNESAILAPERAWKPGRTLHTSIPRESWNSFKGSWLISEPLPVTKFVLRHVAVPKMFNIFKTWNTFVRKRSFIIQWSKVHFISVGSWSDSANISRFLWWIFFGFFANKR